MSNKITVMASIYNEEDRIANFLESVKMFDEIIIFDKCSKDRTVEIAREYGVRIISIYDGVVDGKIRLADGSDRYADVFEFASNEWTLTLTAADIVHPLLYKRLVNCIDQKGKFCDVINVPWVEYLFGCEGEHIPYCHYGRPVLAKKSIRRASSKVHEENSFIPSARKYCMHKDKKVAIHHMTYINLSHSFEKNMRYAKKEVAYFRGSSHPKRDLFKKCWTNIKVCLKFQPHKAGKDAYAIMLYRAVSYYIMAFLYLWAEEKDVGIEKTLNAIYQNLDDTEKRKKVPLKKIIKMIIQTIQHGTITLGWDIIAYILTIINLKIMVLLVAWDNGRKVPVYKIYDDLTEKILNNKL